MRVLDASAGVPEDHEVLGLAAGEVIKGSGRLWRLGELGSHRPQGIPVRKAFD
jgi:hypothetical protein